MLVGLSTASWHSCVFDAASDTLKFFLCFHLSTQATQKTGPDDVMLTPLTFFVSYFQCVLLVGFFYPCGALP